MYRVKIHATHSEDSAMAFAWEVIRNDIRQTVAEYGYTESWDEAATVANEAKRKAETFFHDLATLNASIAHLSF